MAISSGYKELFVNVSSSRNAVKTIPLALVVKQLRSSV